MERKGACRVCGRMASSLVDWNKLSCSGCKVFYRRALKKKIIYKCKFEGKCSTRISAERDPLNPTKRCRSCRFQKCLAIGMKVRGIHPKEKTRKTKNKVTETTKPAIIYLDRENRSPSNSNQGYDVLDSRGSWSVQKTVPDYEGSVVPKSRSCSMTSSLKSSSPSEDPLPPTCYADGQKKFCDENVILDLHLLSDLDYPAEFGGQCLPHLIENARRFSTQLYMRTSTSMPTRFPFVSRSMGYLDDISSRKRITSTACTVAAAAQLVFGEQIIDWSLFMEDALQAPKPMEHTLETNLDLLAKDINCHFLDNIVRILKFATMLPGMEGLDPSAKTNFTAGWKWLIYVMIHHGPFMLNGETFILIGQRKFWYSRFWQEILSEWSLMVNLYKLSNHFRDIGLDQMERYLLMAVVILEPGEDDASPQNLKLRNLHRHYCEVLQDVVKRRCTTAAELATVSRKLDLFFNTFETVRQVHAFYYDARTHPCPPCSVQAKALIVQLQKESLGHENQTT